MNLKEYLEASKSNKASQWLEIAEVLEITDIDVIRGSEICRRRAWYDFNTPEKAEPVETADHSEMVMKTGNAIEEIIVERLAPPFHLETTATGDNQAPIWSKPTELHSGRKFMFVGTPDGWIKEELGAPWKLLEIKSTNENNFQKEKLFPDRVSDSYLEQIRTYLGIMAINEAPPPYPEMTWKDAAKDTERAWLIPYPIWNKAKLIVVNRNSGETLIKDVDTGFRNKENAEDWIRRKAHQIVLGNKKPIRRPGFSEQHPVCLDCKFFTTCYEDSPGATELDGEAIEYFEILTKEMQDEKERSKYASARANSARDILLEEMNNRGITRFALPSGKKGSIAQVRRRGSINTDKMKADGIYDTYWEKGDGTYQQLRITSPKE